MTARIETLSYVSVTVSDLDRLRNFYCDVLGFSCIQQAALSTHEVRRLALTGPATRSLLRLGKERLELLCPAVVGDLYPAHSTATDAWFQHIAIVVSDMQAAYERVCAGGATPITTGGPQRLPASSGGVEAFKFRDPDGHPLELLAFPRDAAGARWQCAQTASPFLGIDHSAIVVHDTAASLAFYERMGLTIAARTCNHGAEQDRLDGVAGICADVIALRPASQPTPHIELLGYHNPPVTRLTEVLATADIASARLVVTVSNAHSPGAEWATGGPLDPPGLIHDPDGHAILCQQNPER